MSVVTSRPGGENFSPGDKIATGQKLLRMKCEPLGGNGHWSVSSGHFPDGADIELLAKVSNSNQTRGQCR